MKQTFIDLAYTQVYQDFKTIFAQLKQHKQNSQRRTSNFPVYFVARGIGFALLRGIYQSIIVVLKVGVLIPFAVQVAISGMIRRIRGIYYVCSSCTYSYCGEPKYRCPECGVANHLLWPNLYGLFHHKCVNCDNMLPTLDSLGKNTLEKCCRECEWPLSRKNGKIPVYQIWIAGTIMSGQTNYLLMSVRQILEGQSGIQGKFEYPDDYKYPELKVLDGRVPADKSCSISTFLLHSEIMDSENLLMLHSAPGEYFGNMHYIRSMRSFDNLEGLVLIVDPECFFTGPDTCMRQNQECFNLVANNVMTRIMEERHQVRKKIPIRVAVVISKADIDWVTSQIGDVREKAIQSETCRQALVNWGCGNIIEAYELNFEHVQYFACSRVGAGLLL